MRLVVVCLLSRAIGDLPARRVARTIGLPPQPPIAPDGTTVGELVSSGRFPHQGPLRRESPEDRAVIERCLERTAFGVRARVIEDPESATPLVVPVFSGRWRNGPSQQSYR